MTLFTSTYPSTERHAELRHCLRVNAEVFDHVYLLGPRWDHGVQSSKISNVRMSHRPTYAELLKFAEMMVFEREVFVIANSDIEIPAAAVEQFTSLPPNSAYALSRYNPTPQGLTLDPRAMDVWVLRNLPENIQADFTQGRPYCHAVFQGLMREAGLRVTNPCDRMVTIHHHAETSPRTYQHGVDVVPGPIFYPLPDSWIDKLTPEEYQDYLIR